MKTKTDVQIRWMIRRDFQEILAIEARSFDCAWNEEDFLKCLRQRNCIGMVAEREETIRGFMVYELLQSQLHVLNFAVSPDFRRQGVGQQMVEKLINKLSQQRRQEITLEVRETNLAAQLFFRKQGFEAFGVYHGMYEDWGDDQDAYAMRFQLQDIEDDPLFVPRNRIAEFMGDHE